MHAAPLAFISKHCVNMQGRIQDFSYVSQNFFLHIQGGGDFDNQGRGGGLERYKILNKLVLQNIDYCVN